MTLTKIAAKTALAAALTGLVLALSMPAEAAKKRKKSYIYYGHEEQHVERTRAGTRIVVRRRSFLDPGTETKQHDEHYTDYAFPPGYSARGIDSGDFKTSFSRMPLPGAYDIPGWPKF